jgi:hypothetical protein
LNITGRWIDAKQALFIGLVAEVVPLRALDRTAHALASAPGTSTSGVRAIAKLAVWEGLNSSLADGPRTGAAARDENLDRLSAAAGFSPTPSSETPRRRKNSFVNTVNFHLDPRVNRARSGNSRLRAKSPDLRGVNELVGRIATVYKKLGLKQRDVVAILDTNSHLYVAAITPPPRPG